MNGKSLEFVKNRFNSGNCNKEFATNKYKTLCENSTQEWLNSRLFESENNKWDMSLVGTDDNGKGFKILTSINYNPDADFEYFTMQRCVCDGTLIFYSDLVEDILLSLTGGETYNKEKEPDDFINNQYEYDRVYEIGDLVLGDEFSSKFATKEKPWMQSRFTVFLPIKMDFVKH